MPYRKEELYDYENFDGSSISSVELLNQDTDDVRILSFFPFRPDQLWSRADKKPFIEN